MNWVKKLHARMQDQIKQKAPLFDLVPSLIKIVPQRTTDVAAALRTALASSDRTVASGAARGGASLAGGIIQMRWLHFRSRPRTWYGKSASQSLPCETPRSKRPSGPLNGYLSTDLNLSRTQFRDHVKSGLHQLATELNYGPRSRKSIRCPSPKNPVRATCHGTVQGRAR